MFNRHRKKITRIASFAAAAALVATTFSGVGGQQEESAQAATLNPSGASPHKGDLDGWRQIFVDEFETDVPLGQFPTKVSGKWKAYKYGWKDSTGKGTYAPNKVVSIKDGVLNKHLHSADGKRYVAAILPKTPGTAKHGQMYGRYAVRMRAEKTSGYKVAWLLWPDTGTVTSGAANGVGGNGEIDFPEADLRQANPHVFGYVHHQNAKTGSDQAWFRKAPHDITKWHTYVIEWSPGLVVLKLDGKELGRTTKRVPNTPMHWVIQTETSFNHPTLASAQGDIEIDWVAAWQYDPNATKPSGATGPQPVAPPPAPTGGGTATDLWVSWPADGAKVDGTSPFKFDGRRSDITAVKWFVDGKEVRYDGRGPTFSRTWNTTKFSNGKHKVYARARLANGTWVPTRTRTFTIDN